MKYRIEDTVAYLLQADLLISRPDAEIVECGNLNGEFFHMEQSTQSRVILLMTAKCTATIEWIDNVAEMVVNRFDLGKLNSEAVISLLIKRLLIVAANGDKQSVRVARHMARDRKRFQKVLESYDFNVLGKGFFFEAKLLLWVNDKVDVFH